MEMCWRCFICLFYSSRCSCLMRNMMSMIESIVFDAVMLEAASSSSGSGSQGPHCL